MKQHFLFHAANNLTEKKSFCEIACEFAIYISKEYEYSNNKKKKKIYIIDYIERKKKAIIH